MAKHCAGNMNIVLVTWKRKIVSYLSIPWFERCPSTSSPAPALPKGTIDTIN
jgi:hypothetical protein